MKILLVSSVAFSFKTLLVHQIDYFKSRGLTVDISCSPDEDADWVVETKQDGSGDWKRANPPQRNRIAVADIKPHRVYRSTITGLKPGSIFYYRVVKDGVSLFESQGKARVAIDQNFNFVVIGDCARDTKEQREIAYQMYLQKPDFVFITGDIVYSRGRISEYRNHYFPVYNSDESSPEKGAPLTRSTLFLASPGNHDIASTEINKYPDLYGYFYYWFQPLNGPLDKIGLPNTPIPLGSTENRSNFHHSVTKNYPRMANFSFDYGNTHWTVLDSNSYMDWQDPELRKWLEKDLASAKKATWRFVAYHHPEFNSADSHWNNQWMRVLSDIFQKHKVDIVFNGHVHNYQRSYPLFFTPKPNAQGKLRASNGEVQGTYVLDKSFDGVTNTKPNGVLHIVTGAGGAGLYDPDRTKHPEEWQPYTAKYIADVHSLTRAEVNGKTLTIRQISKTGEELDKFTIAK